MNYMKKSYKKNISEYVIMAFIIAVVAYLIIQIKREVDEINRNGFFTLGKITKTWMSKGHPVSRYQFTVNGVLYTDRSSYDGPRLNPGDKIYIRFLPNRPTANLPLFKTVVPPCLLLASVPTNGWKTLPNNNCK